MLFRSCYESATTLDYFLADAKKAAVFSVISDMAIILLISAIIVIILLCMISRPMALIERAIGKLADYNLDLAEESEMAKKYITACFACSSSGALPCQPALSSMNETPIPL